jgi:hypothetical protein
MIWLLISWIKNKILVLSFEFHVVVDLPPTDTLASLSSSLLLLRPNYQKYITLRCQDSQFNRPTLCELPERKRYDTSVEVISNHLSGNRMTLISLPMQEFMTAFYTKDSSTVIYARK